VSDLVVRLEDPHDREASLEVERQAFNSDLEAEIASGVRDDEGSFAFVAEVDGEVVGHVQCSRAWVGSDPVAALGPIGVLATGCAGAGVRSASSGPPSTRRGGGARPL
jgi:putative acetyltransferase